MIFNIELAVQLLCSSAGGALTQAKHFPGTLPEFMKAISVFSTVCTSANDQLLLFAFSKTEKRKRQSGVHSDIKHYLVTNLLN